MFEHSLKIRLREDGPASAIITASATAIGTPVSSTEPLPSTLDTEVVQGLEPGTSDTTDPPAPPARSDTPSTQASVPTLSTMHSNLTGRINNLISSDLDNISSARDVLFPLIQGPLEIFLCVWFLYTFLKASAFVGIGLLVVGLVVPAKTAQLTQWAQAETMKAVRDL